MDLQGVLRKTQSPGIQLHLSLECGKGLQMQAASSSKASETYDRSSRRHIPEDCDLHQCCKNFNHMTGSCLCAMWYEADRHATEN